MIIYRYLRIKKDIDPFRFYYSIAHIISSIITSAIIFMVLSPQPFHNSRKLEKVCISAYYNTEYISSPITIYSLL